MGNLERNCFYRILFFFSLISWHSNWASYARGWGFLFRFFDPGAGVLYLKAVPLAGILTEKISSPGGGGGNRLN